MLQHHLVTRSTQAVAAVSRQPQHNLNGALLDSRWVSRYDWN